MEHVNIGMVHGNSTAPFPHIDTMFVFFKACNLCPYTSRRLTERYDFQIRCKSFFLFLCYVCLRLCQIYFCYYVRQLSFLNCELYLTMYAGLLQVSQQLSTESENTHFIEIHYFVLVFIF